MKTTGLSNYCPDVYKNMYIEPVNTDSVNVASCCHSKASLVSSDQLNFYSNPSLVKLREDFNNNLRANECDRCWRLEDTGSSSRRTNMINKNSKIDTKVELKSLDINITWACNLACVMCGPKWSSLWSKELETSIDDLSQLGRKSQKNNPFMDQLNLAQIERVHFNGGEPLINHNHLEVLKQLQKSGSLHRTCISYNTNGTVMPDTEVIDIWRQAKLVKLYFSVDATDQAFEYVRWPADWHQVENNIKQMFDILPSNVMFGFNVTVGCYNIFEIAHVWQWFDRNIRTNREGDLTDFCWQFAYNYDIKHLNTEAKIDAITVLEPISEYQGIVSYLKKHINYNTTQNWFQPLDIIDRRRGTNWNNVLKIGKYY